MAAQILSVLFCLLALIQNAVGSLVLDANPTEISPGATQSLTVNCSFSFDGVSDIAEIISLIISKQNQQKQFEDLVSISIFTPDQITETAQLNGSSTVSGHISPDGQSFLSINWSSTTNSESGLYRCEFSGVNSSRRPTQRSLTLMVTSQTPCCDQLTNIQYHLDSQDTLLQNFQHQLDLLGTVIQNQSHTIDMLLSLIQGQSAMISSQSNMISSLSDMVSSQSNKITDIQIKLHSHMFLTNYTFMISAAYQGHYYLLSKEGYRTSKASEQTCEDYGGYLAEINDSDEQQFVKGFLDSLRGFNGVLISGTREGHPDTWTYTYSGGPLTFTNWTPGQPSAPSTNFCIKMYRYTRGAGWGWHGFSCINNYPGPNPNNYRFMCEVNLN